MYRATTAVILLSLISVLSASATVINVPHDYPTIQEGIDAGAEGDTVLVQPGTYVENINFNGHDIVLGSLFMISGDTSYISSTIIDGDSSGSVVTFDSGEDSTSVITGFTLQNGFNAWLGGGGIICYTSSPAIKYNIIIQNAATEGYGGGRGGGIYCGSSNPSISHNIISGNSAFSDDGYYDVVASGGGIYCYNSNPAIIANVIEENVVSAGGGYNNDGLGYGGGISCEGESCPIIMNNVIRGNEASGYSTSTGGGIYCQYDSEPTISWNLILDNAAENGGGIACLSTNLSISNNVISGNDARYGGGLHINNSHAIIVNNTLSGNSATERGGGIYCSPSSAPRVINAILWGNSAPEAPEIYSESESSIITYCNIQGGLEGEGNLDSDPLFVDPDNDDFRLMSTECGNPDNSPCIDTGHPGVSDGLLDCSRGLGTILSDMGAYGGGETGSGEIQNAINASADGDTVLVQPGVYYENIDFNGRNVTLASLFLITGDTSYISTTVIDGILSLNTVVTFENGEDSTAILTGFTVQNGTAENGGGISCRNNSNPSIGHNLITGNFVVDYGAGILCEQSSPTIFYNTISGNRGNGIACLSSSNPTISDNTINGNFLASRGGGGIYCRQSSPIIAGNMVSGNQNTGIFCDDDSNPEIFDNAVSDNLYSGISCRENSSPQIRNNRISENDGYAGIICESGTNPVIDGNIISENNGPGIRCLYGCDPAITNNTIFGNETATNGGGIYCHSSISEISGNAITGNDAGQSGGGIYIVNSANTLIRGNVIRGNSSAIGGGIYIGGYSDLINNVIFGNSAADSGGGVYCDPPGRPRILNAIIRENTSGNPQYANIYGDPIVLFSNIQGGWEGDGNIDIHPLFVDPEHSNFHLMSVECGDDVDSPCIDAGHPAIIDSLLDCSMGLGTILSDMGAYGGGELATGQDDIQDAINASSDGDTVVIQPGTYYEHINFDGHNIVLGSMFLTTGDTSYISSTIIDGSSTSGSVVTFESGEDSTSALIGFTVRNGSSSIGGGIACRGNSNPVILSNIITSNIADSLWGGGGVSCRQSSPTISQNLISNNVGSGVACRENSNPLIKGNVIQNNSTYSGGGVSCHQSAPVVTENIITANVTSNGGAGINSNESNPTITFNTITGNSTEEYGGGGIRCLFNRDSVFIFYNTISENSSDYGGGIDVNSSNTVIIGNDISNNTVFRTGGGIFCSDCNPVITNNLIGGNLAGRGGGGIVCWDANPVISNNLIDANLAEDFLLGGGGILCVYDANPVLSNNTIVDNVAGRGGAIECYSNSDPVFINSIFQDNSLPELYFDDNSSLTLSYCTIGGGWSGEGNIDVDPLFRDPENSDFHLMSTECGDPYDSPCIDAGHPDSLDSILDCGRGLGMERADMGTYGGNREPRTEIRDQKNQIPARFNLAQNYPNPFNATTLIVYSLPSVSDVTIEIYDILGRRVETVVQGKQPAGYHQAIWDPSGKASGMYFYRIKAGKFAATRKMLLLK